MADVSEGFDLFDKINEATGAIKKKSSLKPTVGIIMGTGLGTLAKKIQVESKIEYTDIPHFPASTVSFHAGNLILGTLAGKKIVAMEGRFHYYEGFSLDEVTFPVRVMRALGAKVLIVSNAAGGMNPKYKKGDIVAIDDHINFMGVNPLIGPNEDKLGPRFPDMCEPYSKRLIRVAKQVAKEKGTDLKDGVYIGVTGPNLETRAEYRLMQRMGADVVGMSTVPEVIVGLHAGLEILGFSVITDLCFPDSLEPVNIEEIIKTANEAGPRLDALVEGVVAKL